MKTLEVLMAALVMSLFAAPAFADDAGTVQEVIGIGKAVWKVIDDNRPVVTESADRFSALPERAARWEELGGWSDPATQTYQVRYKNPFGINVVRVVYQVQYAYNGQYLSGVTIQVKDLSVAWGYHVSAEAAVGSVVNVGTAEFPVAGVAVTLTLKIDTELKHGKFADSFFVRGDGRFIEL